MLSGQVFEHFFQPELGDYRQPSITVQGCQMQELSKKQRQRIKRKEKKLDRISKMREFRIKLYGESIAEEYNPLNPITPPSNFNKIPKPKCYSVTSDSFLSSYEWRKLRLKAY